MGKRRILYVSPEIAPYLPASDNSRLGRDLPTAMQEKKFEVRTFMPNFGSINERRNQLHEVIRLSGVNIPINDADHPMIIKVASMQPSRIQVYFIDNDDYFQKLDSDADALGSNREDNDERVIFFSRGTVDTARKLLWDPDIVHVSGWISSLVPLYLKRVFTDANSFKQTKVIYTVLDESATAPINKQIVDKLKADGIKAADIKKIKAELDGDFLTKIAILYSDAVVFNTSEPKPELEALVERMGIPSVKFNPAENNTEAYYDFYSSLIGENN